MMLPGNNFLRNITAKQGFMQWLSLPFTQTATDYKGKSGAETKINQKMK